MSNWIAGIGQALSNLALPRQTLTSANAHQWWPYSGGQKTTSGVVMDESRSMQLATIFACSRAIAETLGSLPGIVYEEMTEAERGRARGTPQWELLHDSPNPHMDSMQFYELNTLRLVNRGNAFCEIERNFRDEPVALWPIHPSRVRPWKNNDGQLEYHVYVNRTSIYPGERFDGKNAPYMVIPERDMFNIVNFPSDDGVTCKGVLAYARETAGVGAATIQYAGSWFGNGARPSGVIEHPGWIPDPDRRITFREDLNRLHGGPENQNNLGILWEGAKWHAMQMGPDDAKFAETAGYTDKAFCRFYNVPPAVVQIFEDYKFATVDAMIRQFVLTCIRSYAVRWERAINSQILRTRDEAGRLRSVFQDGTFLFEFLLNALLRGDPKTQAEANAILRQWGVLNADEWRAQENLNPIAGGGGSKYVIAANYTTLDKVGQNFDAKATSNRQAEQRGGKWDKAVAAAMLKIAAVGSDRAVREANESTREVIRIPDTEGLQKYAQRVLIEAATRKIDSECRAMVFAAKTPREFLEKVDQFYAKHRKVMADAIATGVDGVLKSIGVPEAVDTYAYAMSIANQHCDQSHEEMLKASECQPNELQTTVQTLVLTWKSRAALFAASLKSETGAAA